MNQGERYFWRLLLCHVKGATSFQNLCQVFGQEFDTFREAARGLLLNDQHYDAALKEAALWETGSQLRHIFAPILVHSRPADPIQLWQVHKHDLADDCAYKLKRSSPMQMFSQEVEIYALYLLGKLVVDMGTKVTKVGLPAAEQNQVDRILVKA